MSIAKQFSLLVITGLLAASTWLWVQKIAIPHQQAESAAFGTPRGNLSDLYPRWLGARELLLHRRDPYSTDITHQIQVGYYGRLLDPSRPHDPKDQQAFAYPIYVVFLLAPIVGLPFLAVQKVLFWIFILIITASLFLWMDALAWRPSLVTQLVWVFLTLSCFPAIQAIKLQQLTVLVAVLLAGFASLLARRYFIWAGILLATATIKPQLTVLPVLWLCIWVLGDWRGRQRAFWGFAVSMAVLVGAGELLLPGWIHEFGTALSAYYQYTGGGNSILDVALGRLIGRIAAVLLVGTFLVLSWQVRSASERTSGFQWSLSLSVAITLAVIPMFAPYNQLLLLPALMVIVRSLNRTWNKNRLSRFFVVITAVAIFEPWLSAATLVIALVFLPGPVVQRGWGLPFYPSLAIPLTTLALLFLSKNSRAENWNRASVLESRTLRQRAASE